MLQKKMSLVVCFFFKLELQRILISQSNYTTLNFYLDLVAEDPLMNLPLFCQEMMWMLICVDEL